LGCRQQGREGEGGAQGAARRGGTQEQLFIRESLAVSDGINKLFMRDPSDLRIKHVNSKMVVFQQNLHIHDSKNQIFYQLNPFFLLHAVRHV
jgi:hypothetical protein